jgi:hypothetical protein
MGANGAGKGWDGGTYVLMGFRVDEVPGYRCV